MKKTLSLLLVLALLIGLVACSSADKQSEDSADATETSNTEATTSTSESSAEEAEPAETAEKQTVKIGFDLPVSGTSAAQAEDYRIGVQLALEDLEAEGRLPNVEFETVVTDDTLDAASAMNCFTKLLYEEEVHVLGGPLSSAIAVACADVWEEAGVCNIVPGWSPVLTNSGYEYVVRGCPNDQIACNTVVAHMVEQGYKNIAMIYINTEQGQPGYDYTVAALEEYGMELCAAETFKSDDKDMTGQIMRIRETNPDAIFYYGGTVADAAVCLQQVKDLCGDSVAIYASTIIGQASFLGLVDPTIYEGAIFFTGWVLSDKDAEFNERFKALKEGGFDASDVACRGYDCIMIIANALESMGDFDVDSETFRADLNEAIHNVEFEGKQGSYKFQPNGDGLSSCLLVQYQDGVQVGLE